MPREREREREPRFTRQEVARIVAGMSRTNYHVARDLPNTPVGERLKDTFRNRAQAQAYVARMFLDDSPSEYMQGWRLYAPPEVRVRGSRLAVSYLRRRPRA